MELVKKVREDRQLTIVYIEHIMKAVMGISDRIIVLHHGKRYVKALLKKFVITLRL